MHALGRRRGPFRPRPSKGLGALTPGPRPFRRPGLSQAPDHVSFPAAGRRRSVSRCPMTAYGVLAAARLPCESCGLVRVTGLSCKGRPLTARAFDVLVGSVESASSADFVRSASADSIPPRTCPRRCSRRMTERARHPAERVLPRGSCAAVAPPRHALAFCNAESSPSKTSSSERRPPGLEARVRLGGDLATTVRRIPTRHPTDSIQCALS